MKRDQIIETRQTLIAQLPVTGEVLRGSLFERTVRHTRGCTICAGGGGHPLWVLTIGYTGGRTRQFSLRREQVDEVRRWLGNYHKLKEALEEIRKGSGKECYLEVRTTNRGAIDLYEKLGFKIGSTHEVNSSLGTTIIG